MSQTKLGALCSQCPWRKSNHGKRSKGGFYTKANLRRLWNNIRRGGSQQSCHLTDPSHPDHIEAGAPVGAKARECPGSIALIAREIEKLNGYGDKPDAYFKANPKGLTRSGVYYWINRQIFGGLGYPPIPTIDSRLVKDTELIARLPD